MLLEIKWGIGLTKAGKAGEANKQWEAGGEGDLELAELAASRGGGGRHCRSLSGSLHRSEP